VTASARFSIPDAALSLVGSVTHSYIKEIINTTAKTWSNHGHEVTVQGSGMV